MLVDDSRFMRRVLKRILLNSCYNVIAEAESGEEAIINYLSHSPQIVLLDITLPIMDGVATLKEIKKINPDAYVIMCSSMGNQYQISEALENGATDFIVKPFFDELIPKLNKLD